MTTTPFRTLYQKTNTGAIQQWTIWVEGTTIHTEFGQVEGKLQHTQDTITEGKNSGKKNATTPETQAIAEASSKWTKQKKKGYVESIEDAENEKVDETLILGGIDPMLSINKSYPKDPILPKYWKLPGFAQRKLDGTRCIAIVKDGKATVWSRSRKPITSVPHIIKELEERFSNEDIILDGELYNHDYKDRFEDLISIIRKQEPDPEGLYKVIQLHVYDCPNYPAQGIDYCCPFKARFAAYESALKRFHDQGVVIPVETFLCDSMETFAKLYEGFLNEGYEGAMAKNAEAPYEAGKRSYNILKAKEFTDDEFKVLDIIDGRGDYRGAATNAVCITKDGKEFEAGIKGKLGDRKKILEEKHLYVGGMSTITFKRLTADGKPYIGKVKCLNRNYE